MVYTSLVIQKLLNTNAHLGRRVAARHAEGYLYGFRNDVAIFDSDKTLICLRNALHFLGSLSRERGRILLVNSNTLYDEIIDQTAAKLGRDCLNDSEWASLVTSRRQRRILLKGLQKTSRSIIGGSLIERPDCVVVMNAERDMAAVQEAARKLIPVVSLVDSNTPLRLYKKIAYPVPASDSVQFVYLFCNLIAKTWSCYSDKSQHPVSASKLSTVSKLMSG